MPEEHAINYECIELFTKLTASAAANATAIAGNSQILSNHVTHINAEITEIKNNMHDNQEAVQNSIHCLALVARSPDEAEEMRNQLKMLPGLITKFNIAAGLAGVIIATLIGMAAYHVWF